MSVAQDVKLFAEKELMDVAESIKRGKAPGLDGIIPVAILEPAKIAQTWKLNLFNTLLRKQNFPSM